VVGNKDERLDFPSNWEINVQEPGGYNAPALTPQQISQGLKKSIGHTALARDRRRPEEAVVTFDDITRGTPVWAVAPWVVSELKAAGIGEDHILFLCAVGSHRMNFGRIFERTGSGYRQPVRQPGTQLLHQPQKIGVTSWKIPSPLPDLHGSRSQSVHQRAQSP